MRDRTSDRVIKTIVINLPFCFPCRQWEEDENATVKPIRQAVVSRILGSTLGQSNQSVQFIEGKVEILLSTVGLNRYDVNKSSAQCAYWNTSEKDWAFDGCEKIPTKGKLIISLKFL